VVDGRDTSSGQEEINRDIQCREEALKNLDEAGDRLFGDETVKPGRHPVGQGLEAQGRSPIRRREACCAPISAEGVRRRDTSIAAAPGPFSGHRRGSRLLERGVDKDERALRHEAVEIERWPRTQRRREGLLESSCYKHALKGSAAGTRRRVSGKGLSRDRRAPDSARDLHAGPVRPIAVKNDKRAGRIESHQEKQFQASNPARARPSLSTTRSTKWQRGGELRRGC